MIEEDLVKTLRANRPQPPQASSSEWQVIAARVQAPSLWQRLWQPWPVMALGGALALGLFVVAVPYVGSEPVSDAALAQSMFEVSRSFGGGALPGEADAGKAYLDLLDQAN